MIPVGIVHKGQDVDLEAEDGVGPGFTCVEKSFDAVVIEHARISFSFHLSIFHTRNFT